MSSVSSENPIFDSPATPRSAPGHSACYTTDGDWLLPWSTVIPSPGSLNCSSSVRKGAEFSLQAFALESGLSETLSEVVLGSVASAMAPVANHRHYNFLILSVVSKHRFESFGQSEEFAPSNGWGLEDLRLNLGQVEVALVNAVVSISASVLLEEPIVGLAHKGSGLLVRNLVDGRLTSLPIASAEVM